MSINLTVPDLAELKPRITVFGVGGAIAFVVGSVMLMDTDIPEFQLPWGLIAGVSVISIGASLVIVGMAIKARGRKVVSGVEAMLGATGEALEDFDAKGRVQILGENWKAVTESTIRQGQQVRVTAVHGLELSVEALDEPRDEGGKNG